MNTVVISEFMDGAAVERLRARHETLYDPDLVDDGARLSAALEGARALIVRNRTQVTAALLAQAPALECVGRLGVGLDNIDTDACAAREVAVYPATGANNAAVAEYVIATALVLLRGAYAASGEVAAGRWPRQSLIGREAGGKVMGLVGYGGIARDVARRAEALGMSVIAHDPYLGAGDPAWGSTLPATLGDLLARADVISLHVPLNDGTRGLIGAPAIASMKPGAILINTARGGVVDEAALAGALRDGSIGGAALDVFATEPLGADDGTRFDGCPNLILTPHVAGVTAESNVRVSALTAERVLAHLDGAP